MSTIRIIIILCLSIELFSQESISMQDAESRQEISMKETYGKSSKGIYRYYKKGADEPFTGVLYANYPDGSMLSWQEYVDGIGQGKWINYYQNGQIKEIGYYNQNKVEGPVDKYYENGALKASGTYKDWRIKIGNWTYYDEEGSLIKEVNYGSMGSIDEVKEYYTRGDISYGWYSSILKENGFVVE